MEINTTYAVNDTFKIEINTTFFGNVLENDFDLEGDKQSVTDSSVVSFIGNEIKIDSDSGSFEYTPPVDFTGIDSFQYVICDDGVPQACSKATVYILITVDTDKDGVDDMVDIDDDNDGILDIYEDIYLDFDGDGIPNRLDIDSDNDGIADIVEWQIEGGYVGPTGRDSDGDGWDDAYDPDSGGVYYEPTDTDSDGYPDYADLDTDNDNVADSNEGHDANFDLIPDTIPIGIDSDGDGLDDAYDTINGWLDSMNPTGSNAPLQDYDSDNIRDWRDVDDDNDGDETTGDDDKYSSDDYPQAFNDNVSTKEDTPVTGDVSQNDVPSLDGGNIWSLTFAPFHGTLTLDEAGGFEYVPDVYYFGTDSFSYELCDRDGDCSTATVYVTVESGECELFIPEIFSPNGDGNQDYFRIKCIENYPNAKIEIYNRWGNLVYEQKNYGNTDVWGTTDAWWDGYSDQKMRFGRDKLPPATYFYILYLNDGSKPRNGFIFLNR